MVEFQRSHVETLHERLNEAPTRLIAIFGPRQTGKTTVVHQALALLKQPNRYEAVDMPEPLERPGPSSLGPVTLRLPSAERNVDWLAGVWEASRPRAASHPRFVLVLDEIQKINGWSDAVKGLWEEDRKTGCPMHVVILGSAPLLMQDGLNESLLGRFETIRLNHWSFPEMSEAFGFNLDQYIFYGGYPGAAPLVHDLERWVTYVREGLVEPNIERDVLSMTRVEKPALLKRVFDLSALYSGQILSYNKMLGQLQGAGNTVTVARYLDLLSKAGLVTGLPKHTNRAVSAKASTPKLHVLNTGLMSATFRYSFDEARSDRSFWGRMVESAVGAHLVNTTSSRTSVKYWKDGNHEVDFVLSRGPHVVGIEVKSGKAPATHSGLSEFERQFKPRNTLIVGDSGVPLHEFLSVPGDHWFEAS